MLRYRSRISGPLLDRMDMHIMVKRIEATTLGAAAKPSDSSAAIGARVLRARKIQNKRQKVCNAYLDTAGIDKFCTPDKEGLSILERSLKRFGLSARAYHRILKVARTIADLDGEKSVSAIHVGEAIMFRQLDRSVASDAETPNRSYAPAVPPMMLEELMAVGEERQDVLARTDK